MDEITGRADPDSRSQTAAMLAIEAAREALAAHGFDPVAARLTVLLEIDDEGVAIVSDLPDETRLSSVLHAAALRARQIEQRQRR